MFRRSLFRGRPAPAPLIQTGNVGIKLIEAFQIKGKSIAPTLGDVIHPVVVVEDLVSSSWYNQIVERPCGGGTEFVPTVGQFASIEIFNPPTSGVVAIVDKFLVTPSGPSGWLAVPDLNNPGTVVPAVNTYRDTIHFPPAQRPACDIRTKTSVALPGANTILQGRVAATVQTLVENVGMILGPGSLLAIYLNVVTLTTTVSFNWRERPVGE